MNKYFTAVGDYCGKIAKMLINLLVLFLTFFAYNGYETACAESHQSYIELAKGLWKTEIILVVGFTLLYCIFLRFAYQCHVSVTTIIQYFFYNCIGVFILFGFLESAQKNETLMIILLYVFSTILALLIIKYGLRIADHYMKNRGAFKDCIMAKRETFSKSKD